MQGFWKESNWEFDGSSLLLPNGQRVTLADIKQWQEQQFAGHFDLTRDWGGWRVRGYWLLPPGATMRQGRVSELHLRRLLAYEHGARERMKLQGDLFD